MKTTTPQHKLILSTLVLAALAIVSQANALVTPTGSADHTDERALRAALTEIFRTDERFPYWNNVGQLNRSTGVYLGNGYVLTAAHVGPGVFELTDGERHAPIPGSETQMRNSDGTLSDLCIFRVESKRGDSLSRLPAIPIGPVCPPRGCYVLMLGAGSGNAGGPSLGPAAFNWNDDYRVRWGLNRVETQFGARIRTSQFQTSGYSTHFGPGKLECQATPGDSGGAAFVYNQQTRRWELGGLILAVDSPRGRVAYGNQTYIADLTTLPKHLFERGAVAIH